ncbi:MAG: HAMP domain-containing histidine kinase [Rhodobacteraceae bacterium]|nr:HAMP domain-containing histidine kinase [Paracoccaceae bacterium]
MDRGNVLSGAAFRAVFLSAVLFLVVLIGAGTVAFHYVRSDMLKQSRNLILEDEVSLSEVHRLEGHDAFVAMVADLAMMPNSTRTRVALFDETGTRIAGDTALPDVAPGWRQADLGIGGTPRPVLFHSTPVGTLTLVSGYDLGLIQTAQTTLVRALGTAGFTIVLAMLATGYFASAGSFRKLEAMEGTLDRVAAGEMTARLPVSDQNDQIDRIARRMNRHLDRLTDLVKRKDQSVSAIAHDLRTPLSRVTLGLDQARRQAERGADPLPALDAALEDLTRLSAIIGTILRIARVETTEPGVNFAPVPLAAIFEDICDTYGPLAEDNDQGLDWQAKDVAPHGDPGMIAQLVANLVQNAITHAGPGARISLRAASRPDGGADLTVADTGKGMTQADRDRAFEAFFRGDHSRSTEGTGLGLALARAIAQHHGAEVQLSDNAPGLRVQVILPSARDQAAIGTGAA